MTIPKEVKEVVATLKKSGYEAYLVGGCVRDLILDQKPNDWDVTTNARPPEITKLFKKHFIDNNFGMVTVLTGSSESSLKEIQVMPYRIERDYRDQRHPSKIDFIDSLQEDLARRDFTINAIALEVKDDKTILVDPFEGQQDLADHIIRAVGQPDERFNEDALRMMRAVRLATTLDFEIEFKTIQAIQKQAHLLKNISAERIRDELVKIIMSVRAAEGVDLLRQVGLLRYIIPELEEGYDVDQNKHHIYNVYEHSIRSLRYAAEQGFNLHVRLAALLHDVAKPKTKSGQGAEATFYNHEVVGANMTEKIMKRLRFPSQDIRQVVRLVRYHLFYYNVDEVGESSVRKLIRRVGLENIPDLIQVRMADRIGSGVPKAKPYKLRHLEYMVEHLAQDPISTEMLAVNGYDIMQALDIKPGPKIGQVLHILLEQVLEDPKKNKKEILLEEVRRLGQLSDEKLMEQAEKSKQEIDKVRQEEDLSIREKFYVK
ncbi:MAG TPA: HD domain-containing protein [Candidatus Pacearchaeota archaeon]|nr:HD domain-containing protein [Candidatus Pacearchaeota archaeon]